MVVILNAGNARSALDFYNFDMLIKRVGAFLGVFCAMVLSSFTRDFSRPVPKPCDSYPAHEERRDAKVCIAADPYDTPEKAHIFSVNFAERGFLPLFFVITNNGDRPISFADLNVQLITAHHSKLTPVTPDDLYRRMVNPQARMTPSPLPIPRKRIKGTISDKDRNEIESAQFGAQAVEPHTTQSGFLFFDVAGIPTPLSGAELDVSRVFDADGKELLYFEISMERSVGAAQ